MRIGLKLLVATNSGKEAQVVVDELVKHGYQLETQVVTCPEELGTALEGGGLDTIIIDCAIERMTCRDALIQVRSVNADTPVVLISDTAEKCQAGDALRDGADDIVYRDNIERLIPSVEQVLKDAEIRRMREQVEQSLWESEKRYRELVMNMGEGLVLLDVSGKFAFANPMAEKFFGQTSIDLIGKQLAEFIDAEQLVTLKPELDKLDQGRESSFTITLNRSTGEERILRVTFNPRYSADGSFQGMIGPMMDITEQVGLERQLRHMQTMEAIGALAGGIAHDFNNILFSILGNADLALSEVDPAERIHQRLTNIVTAGNRAKSLIKQILAFARKTEQERIVVEVYPILREVHKLLRATIPANIEIDSECDDRSAAVVADPTELHQVVMNLCTNACQAMLKTGGELKLTQQTLTAPAELAEQHEEITAGQDIISIEINDSGSGIPAEILDKIFEPFFTTKAPGEGTGLGLVVAQGIVKSMEGVITVRSSVGEGTSFTILLPRAAEQVDDFESFIRELPHGTERVLLVDDEEVLTRMVGEMLTSLGYTVTCFNSSVDALGAFSAGPGDWDLIITDQAMPKMTGGELSQKALKIRPELPIILCTGFSQTLTPEMAEKTGIREYLLKPITLEDLSAVVRKVLDEPAGLTRSAGA